MVSAATSPLPPAGFNWFFLQPVKNRSSERGNVIHEILCIMACLLEDYLVMLSVKTAFTGLIVLRYYFFLQRFLKIAF
jgi:hypothetical protein